MRCREEEGRNTNLGFGHPLTDYGREVGLSIACSLGGFLFPYFKFLGDDNVKSLLLIRKYSQ